MSERERDSGPMARFEAVKADPAALGVILQRLGARESLRSISRAWRIPYRELCEWIREQGRALVNARCGSSLRLVERQRAEQQSLERDLI